MPRSIPHRALPSFLACFLSLLAHALAEVQYQVTFEEGTAQPHQRLFLILLDGFRYDYLEQRGYDFPGFRQVINSGARPRFLIPDFPTLSYPNYYSLMTGLHTEQHGMTGNYMYDVRRKESFLIGYNKEQYHPHWWEGGEPLWVTAVKQNRTCYMYDWPGCEVQIHGVTPTYCRAYKGVPDMDAFRDAITKSLKHMQFDNVDVAAIYFELTDSLGHRYGPHSARLMQVITDLDPLMGYLAQSLTSYALSDVNLVIVSDHGMTPVSRNRVINLNDVIVHTDYDAMWTDVAIASIYTKAGKENEVYRRLKGFHPNLTVYRRHEIPDRWHYKNGRYVAPVTGVADMGWFILGPDKREFPIRRDGLPMAGWHGWAADSNSNDMMGIFIGMGPGFRRNVTSEPIKIVDVYQMMCQLLGIQASPNSGSWSRVADIVTFDVSPASQAMTSSSLLFTSLILSCAFGSVMCWCNFYGYIEL